MNLNKKLYINKNVMSIKNYITESFVCESKDDKPYIKNFVERKQVEKLHQKFKDFLEYADDIEFFIEKGIFVESGEKDGKKDAKDVEDAFELIKKHEGKLHDVLWQFDNYIKNGGKI